MARSVPKSDSKKDDSILGARHCRYALNWQIGAANLATNAHPSHCKQAPPDNYVLLLPRQKKTDTHDGTTPFPPPHSLDWLF